MSLILLQLVWVDCLVKGFLIDVLSVPYTQRSAPITKFARQSVLPLIYTEEFVDPC